jgi:glycolate oxidase
VASGLLPGAGWKSWMPSPWKPPRPRSTRAIRVDAKRPNRGTGRPARTRGCRTPGARRILEKSAPIETRVAKNSAERLAIWKGRKSAFKRRGDVSRRISSCRTASCPGNALGEALRRIGETLARRRTPRRQCFPRRRRQPTSVDSLRWRETGRPSRAPRPSAGEILRLCVAMGGMPHGRDTASAWKSATTSRDRFSAEEIAFMRPVAPGL